jgi:HlyD family secretion protein
MTSSAEIIVGQRSIISYFLYPVLRVFDESLREP